MDFYIIVKLVKTNFSVLINIIFLLKQFFPNIIFYQHFLLPIILCLYSGFLFQSLIIRFQHSNIIRINISVKM